MNTAITGAEEITHIVAESSREPPLRKPGPAGTDDFNSFVLLPLEETPPFESVPVGLRGDERKARHYGDLAPVVPYKTFAELGEKLARGRRVRVKRPVKEGDMQGVHYSNANGAAQPQPSV